MAKPSVEQARDVFEARRLIEPSVMRRLALNMDAGKKVALRERACLESFTISRLPSLVIPLTPEVCENSQR